MTLTEFLLARIAEDEAAAGRVLLDFGGGDLESLEARVLAECEAKRRIVDEHESREVASLDRETWAQTFTVCGRCRVGERQIVAPCPTLRLLALPYADNPDYDEAWRP